MTHNTPTKAPMTAEQARDYIRQFAKHTFPGTEWVGLSSGRRVYLNQMTDEDALMIAKNFMAMEQEAAENVQRQ